MSPKGSILPWMADLTTGRQYRNTIKRRRTTPNSSISGHIPPSHRVHPFETVRIFDKCETPISQGTSTIYHPIKADLKTCG